jgi:glutamate/tyrosine decarboxylase-like PLP-dependent enzyme
MPAYLEDTETKHGEINFGEHGIQLSRSFRALKLWLSLKVFGRQAFARAIERGFALAELAERTLAQTSEWTIVTPAEMAVVSFCLALPGLAPETRDHIHQALIEALKQDGFALVTSTRLKGRVVLRMCTINPRTTDADIVATVERLTALAKAVVS